MKISGRRARFTSSGRERSWWLVLAVVLAAVLWAIAQVLGWPVWARAVLAGLAAVGGVDRPRVAGLVWAGRHQGAAGGTAGERSPVGTAGCHEYGMWGWIS